jgi:hypothetical protein
MELNFVSWIFAEDEVGAGQNEVLEVVAAVGGQVDDGELAYILPVPVVVGEGQADHASFKLPDHQAEGEFAHQLAVQLLS